MKIFIKSLEVGGLLNLKAIDETIRKRSLGNIKQKYLYANKKEKYLKKYLK